MRWALAGATLLLGVMWCGSPGNSLAQTAQEDEPRPQQEQRLRRDLRKLDRWGLLHLLRTERDIDQRQKQQAAASTRPQELTLLAGDEDSGVRFFVAVNPYTPVAVLRNLAQDSLAYVRGGVALSLDYDAAADSTVRHTVERIGAGLAADPQPLVRLALATNIQLPAPVLQALARDPDPLVREKLAANRSLSRAALRVLAADSVIAVRSQALLHPNMPIDELTRAAGSQTASIRLAVSENPNAPVPVLDSLSADVDAKVRLAVARHPATPASALVRLADDKNVQVVIAAARHANAPRDMLLRLAKDPRDIAIRTAAQQHLEPLLRSEIREDVLERWDAR